MSEEEKFKKKKNVQSQKVLIGASDHLRKVSRTSLPLAALPIFLRGPRLSLEERDTPWWVHTRSLITKW